MILAPITDLQYAFFECELTLDQIAARTGSTPTALREELARTPMPDWLVASAKQLLTREGGHGAASLPYVHSA